MISQSEFTQVKTELIVRNTTTDRMRQILKPMEDVGNAPSFIRRSDNPCNHDTGNPIKLVIVSVTSGCGIFLFKSPDYYEF